jgi:hypothetical protein
MGKFFPMKKVVNFLLYASLGFFWSIFSVINNGDPFDYIGSDIKKISHQSDLDLILEDNSESLVVIFSYLNYCYGSLASDFYEMASIYDQLKKNFSSNKKVKCYRAHTHRGFSSLVGVRMPAMHIFYNKAKIKTVSGKKTKEFLFSVIINELKNLSNRGIFLNLNIFFNFNGGDDGN